MAEKQFVVQMGMGTDLRGHDYSRAAAKAVRNALHRNFLSVGRAFGFGYESMRVRIRVGVGRPEEVDLQTVRAEAPVGQVEVEAVRGGLDIDMAGQRVLLAHAIVAVSFDVET